MFNELSYKIDNLFNDRLNSDFFKFEPTVKIDYNSLSTFEYKK